MDHIMQSNPFTLGGYAFAACSAYLLWRFYLRQTWLPLPPGPKPRFLIGNLLDIPRSRPCLTYLDWAQRYGPLVYLDVVGKPTVVLNTYAAATDLLDKRGQIYSDRPRIVMMGELVGLENNTSLERFGPKWKKQRKIMNKALNAGVVRTDYSALQEYKAREYLYNLLRSPGNVLKNIGRVTGETMTEITYGGHEMDGVDFVDLSDEISHIISASFGHHLVDHLPLLKMVPDWVPGARFKRDAKIWRRTYFNSRDYLFNTVKLKKASNDDIPTCYVSRLLDDIKLSEDQEADEEAIKATSFTFYRAGTESTKIAIEAFFLAMTLYPAVQAKAQAELDRVAKDRLPTVADQEHYHTQWLWSLKHCAGHHTRPSVTNELSHRPKILRFLFVGVLHRLMEDDIYEGYRIPAGSTVYPNVWAISHDAATYPNPNAFDPERFYSRNEFDPRNYAFGFGRRACPGIHLGLQGLFITISSILWSFSIKARKDLTTFEVKPENLFDLGLISRPLPFECEIESRSSTVGQRLSEVMGGGK